MRSTKNGQQFTDGSRGNLAVVVAKRLIEMHRHGSDLKRAIHEVAKETGLSYWTLESWWKGKKDGGGSVLKTTLDRLLDAYEIECARQISAFQLELKEARRLNGHEIDQALVRAAIAVAGDAGNEEQSPSFSDHRSG